MEKVSVIMPCYNDGKYIMEAIDSIGKQTYQNWELIIVDDGSDDEETKQIINEIQNPKIKVFHTEHLRPARARNYGIQKAEGKYILPVDSDDRIHEEYMEKAVKKIESNSQIGVVYCKAELFGEKNGPWNLPDYSFEQMLLDNIVFVTALFYKSDWEKVGGFNTSMAQGMEDYDFWLSILELGREVYQIPKRLFYYRKKSTSRSLQFDSNIDSVKAAYRLLYVRHSKLYEMHSDEYCIVLREEIIKLNFYIARLEQVTGIKLIKDIFNRFRVLGILKNFIKNRLLKND